MIYNVVLASGIVQSLSHVQLFAAPWTAAHQASLFFTISWNLLKFMFIELMMPSNHLILYASFSSCTQSFPASGSFPVSQLFASAGQKYWSFSFSNSPFNEYSGLISFRKSKSKRFSRVFSNTQLKSINSLALSFLHSPPLTSIHDYWKNHSLD